MELPLKRDEAINLLVFVGSSLFRMKKNWVLLICVLLLACKKEEDVPLTNEPVPDNQIPPASTSAYDALFSYNKNFVFAGSSYVNSGSQAFGIYSSKTIYNELYVVDYLQNIGSVSLNNITLKNKSAFANNYYNDTSSTNHSIPLSWKITGASNIDSFSYVNPNQLPQFNGSKFLPDSLSLKTGLQFVVRNLSNADLIKVSVIGATGSTQYPIKLLAATDTVIYLPPKELEGLKVSNASQLFVQFFKENYRLINGKKINFRTALSYNHNQFKVRP